jgi:hypothetical protein
MSAHHDDEASLSALAVRAILEMSTQEILRLVVGLGSPNMTELLDNLVPADRQLLAAQLRSRLVNEAFLARTKCDQEYVHDAAETAAAVNKAQEQESTGKKRATRWRTEAIEIVRKRAHAREHCPSENNEHGG